MIKNKNIELLIKKYNENKLSHVFLIETNNKEKALNDLINFVKIINCENDYADDCKKCNLCHLISNNILSSLKIIYPDGMFIKKEQMIELKNYFNKIPFISKFNIYIINDAEKFNSSSANTMLKFIEEPTDKTIGFLITNNKENVINTIKSRCEIIKSIYEKDNNEYDEQLASEALKYLINTETKNNYYFKWNKEILDLKYDKDQLQEFFQIILQKYFALLTKDINDEIVELKTIPREELLKRINIVNEIIDRLNYNVNINLLLDYFALNLEV